MMHAAQNFQFIPTTIDELMFRFCLNEKRKESERVWKQGTEKLLGTNVAQLTDEDIYSFVHSTLESMTSMIGEDNSDFSRFRNEQNRIYLKLLEIANAEPGVRSSLLIGTDQE